MKVERKDATRETKIWMYDKSAIAERLYADIIMELWLM